MLTYEQVEAVLNRRDGETGKPASRIPRGLKTALIELADECLSGYQSLEDLESRWQLFLVLAARL